MKKAYAYVRVSGKGQVDGDGYERQEEAIYRYAKDSADWHQVTADARRLGNRTVFKRLGYLVELAGVEVGQWLERWQSEISAGETLLDPRYGCQGAYHSGWNLRLNVSEEQLLEWRRH